MRPGPEAQPKKLLTIWGRDRDIELSFSDLVSRAESKLHLEKRTAINYANFLVKSGILEKRVDVNRKTYYKSKDKKELDKAILKAEIDNMNQQELKDLDAFAFILYLERYKQIQDDPQHKDDYFKAVESAKKQFLDIKHAMNTIDEAVRHIQEEKATPELAKAVRDVQEKLIQEMQERKEESNKAFEKWSEPFSNKILSKAIIRLYSEKVALGDEKGNAYEFLKRLIENQGLQKELHLESGIQIDVQELKRIHKEAGWKNLNAKSPA